MSPRNASWQHYIGHTLPGFQQIAWSEVDARAGAAKLVALTELHEQNGIVLFDSPDEPHDLLAMRTLEDLFQSWVYLPDLPWGREGLSEAYNAVRRSPTRDTSLRVWERLRGFGASSPVRFRVVARLRGRRQPYHRLDLQRSVEKAVIHGSRGRWKLGGKDAAIEVWATLTNGIFVCGLRLSAAEQRHRDYKVTHLPGSLRPSIAAAMALLTVPEPDDVFLDPLCGGGTILVERALLGRHRLLIGGDLEPEAVAAAAENIGPKHKPRTLFRWNAGSLPLDAGSVTKIATNLPFGVKIQPTTPLPKLYTRIFGEIDRVLSDDGRAVVLSSQSELIREVVRELPRLVIDRGYNVNVLGQRARVYVVRHQ